MAGGEAAHAPPGPPTQLHCGEGSPRGSPAHAEHRQSGWRGSAGPYPQEGRPSPKAGHGCTLAPQGPGRLAAKLTGGWEAGQCALPPLQSGGPVAWAGLGDPPKCSDGRGGGAIQAGGTHWSGGKKGAEDRAATAQKRPQGAGQEPGCGLPGEDEEQLLVQGRLIRWGLSTLQAPHALNPSQKRAAWPPGASGGGGPAGPGQTLPLPWAKLGHCA